MAEQPKKAVAEKAVAEKAAPKKAAPVTETPAVAVPRWRRIVAATLLVIGVILVPL